MRSARAPRIAGVVALTLAGTAVAGAGAGSTRVALAASADADPAQAPTPTLDHVTIAVRDLGAAGRLFAALGFTVKPGRPHANSIDNLHLKFADGTELELLTASEPRDSLAAEYLAILGTGDGGAFVALRHPDIGALAAALGRHGRRTAETRAIGLRALTFPPASALRPVWFIEAARPVIDTPAITTHENGALRLASAWLSGAAAAEFADLAGELGLERQHAGGTEPASPEIRLAGGAVCVGCGPAAGSRGVSGVSIEVADIEAAAAIVTRAGVGLARGSDVRGRYLRIPPATAHGVWLELVEPGRAR